MLPSPTGVMTCACYRHIGCCCASPQQEPSYSQAQRTVPALSGDTLAGDSAPVSVKPT